jgi:hypothetical protein
MIGSKNIKQRFARTYDHPSYDDPYNAIRDYERAKRKAAANPNKGSSALSSILELPRGRIRSWVDGDGMPDCYRGLQTAQSNGWITDSWNEETARGLNCLAAWIVSSGGINDNFVPAFVAGFSDEYETLSDYAHSAGIRLQRTRESDEDRPPEWIPRSDASVLGRVLYTWIGIKGNKSRDRVEFPAYLREAPEFIVQDFLRVYVQQRGVYRDDRGGSIQLSANRTDSFRRSLKSRLQDTVDAESDIRGEAWPLRICGTAMETLGQYPNIEI